VCYETSDKCLCRRAQLHPQRRRLQPSGCLPAELQGQIDCPRVPEGRSDGRYREPHFRPVLPGSGGDLPRGNPGDGGKGGVDPRHARRLA